MEDIVENPSEDYLSPRKINYNEHSVQVTTVKFEDLKRNAIK